MTPSLYGCEIKTTERLTWPIYVSKESDKSQQLKLIYKSCLCYPETRGFGLLPPEESQKYELKFREFCFFV